MTSAATPGPPLTLKDRLAGLGSSTDTAQVIRAGISGQRGVAGFVVGRSSRPCAGDAAPRDHSSKRTDPMFRGAGGFDLELIASRTLDGHTQELTHLPTLRR